jgi:cell division septation protein DedD
MGIRNSLILFFSAMAVSMVILIVFFSLFFKNFDNLITFDTRMPDMAPTLGSVFDPSKSAENSRVEGLEHSTINVPMETVSSSSVGTSKPASGDTATTDPLLEPGTGAGVPGVTLQDDTQPSTDSQPEESPKNIGTKNIDPMRTPTLNSGSTPGGAVKPSTSTKPSTSPTKASSTSGNTSHQVVLEGFKNKEDAQKAAESLKAKGINPIVKEHKGKPVVQVGSFSNPDNAKQMAEKTGGRVKPAATSSSQASAPPVPGE